MALPRDVVTSLVVVRLDLQRRVRDPVLVGERSIIGKCRYHRKMLTSQAAPAVAAARMFRGFADPTRVAILLELLDGERRVADLVERVGGSQSNVSGHLACLRECGLVNDRPGERRQVFYRLSGPEVVELLEAAERLLAANGDAVALCCNPLMEGTTGDAIELCANPLMDGESRG